MLTSTIIGNKIAKARKRQNISQAQLAERLFISPQAVGKWERGESMPDIITFNRLAEILGIDLNYFSETFRSTAGEESTNESSPVKQESVSSRETENKPAWDMSFGNWTGADFSGLKNLHEKFRGANMRNCLFAGSELTRLLLKGNHVENCDFTACDFSKGQIRASHLAGNKFNGCFLWQTEFSGSQVSSCDFTGADLTSVGFQACTLEKNSISGAIWKRTVFKSSQLSNMVFEGTLEDCTFENCSFYRVTFNNAILLNSFFKNKSLKKIRFIDCQADRITYEFLKNGKADMSGIKQITS